MPRRRFALAALLFALLILYGGTVIGPNGMNYVPLPLDLAWQRFQIQATTWVAHGSDQRSDWMGNLMMLVPFGFIVTGSLWPAGKRGRGLASIGAFVLAMAVVLGVKFAQVWFPPRTVTLNYVVAQAAGSAIGITLFRLTHGPLSALGHGFSGGPLLSLAVLLRLYTAALVVFMLMPLDFALNAEDLQAVLDRLPDVAVTVTGAGRPPIQRATLVLGATIAVAPIGMLLTIVRDRGRLLVGRSAAAATGVGFVMMSGVLVLTCLVLSSAPSLAAVAYRTLGITIGAVLMRGLVRQDAAQLRLTLSRLVPWLVLPYLLLLAGVNGLISLHWRGPAEALATVYWLGFIPGFDYYIVTKAEAAKNIVAHAVMYVPVGVMVWLRVRTGTGAGLAALLAGLLSFAVECARYLRPGLEGDINAIAVAALSAGAAASLMPLIWRLVESVALARTSTGVVGWRERAAVARKQAESGIVPTGEIERY